MKLYSKKALVLGGLYGVFDAPFSLLGLEFVSSILFLIFIGCCVMLCFNKTPKFLSAFTTKFPNLSYYLAAFGWVPFFMIIVLLGFIGSGYVIDYSDAFIEQVLNVITYPYTGLGLVFVSLIIGHIKRMQG